MVSSDVDFYSLNQSFQERLSSESRAIGYLHRRLGSMAGEMVEKFQLGLAPMGWPGASYFADRITLPMWSGNDIVGFRGKAWRIGDPRPKGVPWPRSVQQLADPLGISPSTLPILERLRFAVLVEGEIDLLTLWGLGIPAVASCMSSLTQFAASRIAWHVDHVIVWADNDDRASKFAGQQGGRRSATLLKSFGVGVSCVVCPVANVKDANDLYLLHGGEQVKQFVQKSIELHQG